MNYQRITHLLALLLLFLFCEVSHGVDSPPLASEKIIAELKSENSKLAQRVNEMQRQLEDVTSAQAKQNTTINALDRFYVKNGDAYRDIREQILHSNSEMLSNVRHDNDKAISEIDSDNTKTIIWITTAIGFIGLLFGVGLPIFLTRQGERQLEENSKNLTKNHENNLEIKEKIWKKELEDIKTEALAQLEANSNNYIEAMKKVEQEINLLKNQITELKNNAENSAEEAKKSELKAYFSKEIAAIIKEKDNQRQIELCYKLIEYHNENKRHLAGSVVSSTLKAIYKIQAHALYSANRLKEALKTTEIALNQTPNDYILLRLQGEILTALKEFEKAENKLKESETLHKDHPRLYKAFADLYTKMARDSQYESKKRTYEELAMENQNKMKELNDRQNDSK